MAEIENQTIIGDGRWSLKGMNALVTGGTKGIGYAIVEELANFGANIYTCSRNQNDLDNCIQEWKKKGYKVTGSACDLKSKSQRQQLMENVSNYFDGKLHILVNNARVAIPKDTRDHIVNNVGVAIPKDTIEFNEEDYSVIMGTNFEAPYNLCQLAYPLLKATGQGNIVFISSVAGLMAFALLSLYSASKGALNQLTKSLACEWGKDNIRVNCVTPWFIKTPLSDAVSESFEKEKIERAIERTPISRYGKASDVASLVAYLCLPAASWITAQIISVDGGVTANLF